MQEQFSARPSMDIKKPQPGLGFFGPCLVMSLALSFSVEYPSIEDTNPCKL